MFDLGFSEIFLVAVVALVVLGPERLPKATRFVGLWVRRARAQWQSVKGELERELASEELKRNLEDARTAMRDLETSARSAGDDARSGFESMRDETLGGIDPTLGPPSWRAARAEAEADAAARAAAGHADTNDDVVHASDRDAIDDAPYDVDVEAEAMSHAPHATRADGADPDADAARSAAEDAFTTRVPATGDHHTRNPGADGDR